MASTQEMKQIARVDADCSIAGYKLLIMGKTETLPLTF